MCAISSTEGSSRDDFSSNKHGSKPLHAIIVGAGVAGLLTAIGLRQSGHAVTILERASSLSEVGAGIQCAPNITRILARFGILKQVLEAANVLDYISVRRWQDDKELGKSSSRLNQRFSNPLTVVHRADLQRILVSKARAEDVEIRLGSHVIEVDPDFEARVRLASGKWVEGHVLIVADGARSEIRRQMMDRCGIHCNSSPSGDSAHRVLVSRDWVQHDQEILKLFDSNAGYRWLGPGSHIMAYPVRNKDILNMVFVHPQKAPSSSARTATSSSKTELQALFQDWNLVIRTVLEHIPEDGPLLDWPLESHSPLPLWHQNKTLLIGDSCHPMLPYVAQGAAQSAEDAGVLAVIFSHTANVPLALKIYESVRKTRAEAIQHSALLTRQALHLPDGPEQIERDRTFVDEGKSPDLWIDRDWQKYMWDVDVMKEVDEAWDDLMRKHGSVDPPSVG